MEKETARLRPLEEDDLLDLYAIRSHPAVAAQFFNWRPVTRTGQAEWYENIRRDPDKLAFVLVGADPAAQGRAEAQSDIVIGFGQITNIDHRNGTCEVGGFMIRPRLQKRGYGSQLISLLLDFCDSQIGIRKVSLEALCDNEAALSIYEKLGFQEEGIRKRHVFKDGAFRDVICMAAFKR